MKLSIALIFCVLCATTYGKPGLLAPVLLTSSQYHSQDQLGQYSYGYSNPQSAKAELKTADGITQGSYSYVDADGKLQSVRYTSDEINGFRVAATNLPSPVLSFVNGPIASHQVATLHQQGQQDALEISAAKSKNNNQEEQLIQFQDHDQDQDQQILADEGRSKEDKPIQQHVQVHHQVHHQPILKSSLLTYASPLIPAVTHVAAPGFAYSYGYAYPHYTYVNHLPTITTYAATPYIATHHIGTSTTGQLPAVPAETPEVAKARAEHIKAHEEAKARNL